MKFKLILRLSLVVLSLISLNFAYAQCEQWYIPSLISNGPIVFVCADEVPTGYFLADQDCAQSIVDQDQVCINSNWDTVCQNSYNNCLYGTDCSNGNWYIPNEIASAPIVWDCSAPEGYQEANKSCAQSIVNDDPFCVNTNWDFVCSSAYNCCIGNFGCFDDTACNYDPTLCPDASLCEYEQYYIPLDLNMAPMVLACEQPEGYFLADQDCAQYVVDIDPFCLNNNWDMTCQERYNSCLYELDGCFFGDWFIPNEGISGPIVYACAEPDGYFLADQNCAQTVVNNDPFCVNVNWDSTCWRAYNCCLGNYGCGDDTACNYDPTLCNDVSLCVYPEYYIPIVPGLGPAILACERPTDYMFANQSCAEFVIGIDPYCLNNSWDEFCQEPYDCCLNTGCTDTTACNYLPGACTDDGSCVFLTTSCPGDFNGDELITSSDLTAFLAVFGSNCND